RKVRCTGTQPCDYCSNEGVRCEYADGGPRPGPTDDQGQAQHGVHAKVWHDPRSQTHPTTSRDTASAEPIASQHSYRPDARQPQHKPSVSRPASLEPPQTFAEGQHIGPSAGVSFLYHGWSRGATSEEEASLPPALLTCHGDIPQPPANKNQPLPTTEEARILVERYFQFATPTYRFLHRPTVEQWTSHLLEGRRMSISEMACVLIVFSQALLYTTTGDRYHFDKARSLLNQEPGPGIVYSVQARLAMCLYLLSTFRINECRFCFSLACTILTSIELHRKTPATPKLDLLTLESRKRTFWCAYVLDNYLSVMLGRPRILHDGDIDQEYPRNINDHDLLSSESPEDLPLHGNLEAFIAQADIAKLMARNSQLLYPLQSLTENEVFERTNEMLKALNRWRDSLPEFLKPRDKTLAGQRTFERQNTVLKFAHAHLRILITRRCLLADFNRLGRSAPSIKDDRALKPIQECMTAVCTILNAVLDVREKGSLYQSFWFTPYVALVAISTLYVFIIQDSRSILPQGLFPEIATYFEKAKFCQKILAALSPEGSQAHRHHRLLDRLRDRAEKDAAHAGQGEEPDSGLGPPQPSHMTHIPATNPRLPLGQTGYPATQVGTSSLVVDRRGGPHNSEATFDNNTGPVNMMIGQFAPSEDDYMFHNLLSWGWESLDTHLQLESSLTIMASIGVMSPVSALQYEPSTASDHDLPTSYLPPPLPAPRTITELLSLRASELPNEPILGYPSHDHDYVEYTFSDLESFSARLAEIYSTVLPARSSSHQDARVVALLGLSNLGYSITALALSRLGFTVLFLSTRLSEAAYLSLLEATNCQHMVIHPSFHKIAASLKSSLPALDVIEIRKQSEYASPHAPTFGHLQTLNPDLENSKICWIIHSSGSTGLPKPIYQTHRAALGNYQQNMNMRGFITLPLFHAHGLSSVFRAITSVKKIYMHNANLPMTRQGLLQILTKHKFEIFYGVPYGLKLLSESQDGIDALAAMKVVMFGGSPCPDALGDLLANNGVNLISHYGTTETGQLMTSSRPPGDKVWNYLRMHEKLRRYVRWDDRGGNLYELVVLDGWPSKVATNRDDGSFATKDLFEPHPTLEGAWKHSGRLDDTIVLTSGEKAIPIAMEQAVRQNKLVQEAVMFGTGKAQVGMIIIASDAAATLDQAGLLDAIWPTIKIENQILPAYAQLVRDMIKVIPAGTPYPSTDKGTMIRQAFYRAFETEIEGLYHQLDSNATGALVLTDVQLRQYLRETILELAPQDDSSSITDTTDLFSLGVDSLQSTRIRVHIMRDIQLNGNVLPPNVVFEYPTLAKLASAILSIRDSKVAATRDVTKEMENRIAKYSVFPQHVPVIRTSKEKCVVVTGATGSLGAHLVAQLLRRDDISEVCCLVRAESASSAHDRVVKSMKDRGVYEDDALFQTKVTCYASDFSKPDLGLGEANYASIANKITALIHSAWSVNFNKNLSSFEADCIAGARRLTLLCLAARQGMPASFNFCSSVSAVANTNINDVVSEDLPPNLACVQGMGYAQSKLVTEHLVVRAAKQNGMEARVLRIGQITADTVHGIWNDTEAIPLMLQAATTIGALPALDEFQRWLPVDTVATTVTDISLSSTKQHVFNVVNPRAFNWTRDLLPALRGAGLPFEEVGQRDWVRKLRASNPDPRINPTIKLVEFFAQKYDNDVTERKGLRYITAGAEGLSPALGLAPALSTELVEKFVGRFLQSSWKK
ncbi:hypothetical protein EDD37DRAFT_560252, partial [Exophiala viscosa]|uniref:uncharacterized protein n=1 Tax=Exophiala viscosa TaxID=2486360 RepID=UPI0021A0CB16